MYDNHQYFGLLDVIQAGIPSALSREDIPPFQAATFDLSTFELLLARLHKEDLDDLRVVRGNHIISSWVLLRRGGAGRPRIDMAALRTLVQSGYSVAMSRLERRSVELTRSCMSLTAAATRSGFLLSDESTVNGYFTPSGARAFLPHTDAEDVLVLQMDGRKSWRVWAPTAPVQAHSRSAIPMTELGEVVVERVLEPGDVLYVPGGFPHEASTADGLSFHLTFALPRLLIADVVADVVADTPALRVPVGPRPGSTAAQAAKFLSDWHLGHTDAAVLGASLKRLKSCGPLLQTPRSFLPGQQFGMPEGVHLEASGGAAHLLGPGARAPVCEKAQVKLATGGLICAADLLADTEGPERVGIVAANLVALGLLRPVEMEHES